MKTTVHRCHTAVTLTPLFDLLAVAPFHLSHLTFIFSNPPFHSFQANHTDQLKKSSNYKSPLTRLESVLLLNLLFSYYLLKPKHFLLEVDSLEEKTG